MGILDITSGAAIGMLGAGLAVWPVRAVPAAQVLPAKPVRACCVRILPSLVKS